MTHKESAFERAERRGRSSPRMKNEKKIGVQRRPESSGHPEGGEGRKKEICKGRENPLTAWMSGGKKDEKARRGTTNKMPTRG